MRACHAYKADIFQYVIFVWSAQCRQGHGWIIFIKPPLAGAEPMIPSYESLDVGSVAIGRPRLRLARACRLFPSVNQFHACTIYRSARARNLLPPLLY